MPEVLVVYESMFGDAKAVATAIAQGLSTRHRVTVRDVGSAPTAVPEDLALLVVGGPNHRFGMSTADSRLEAVAQGATSSAEVGVRDWTARLGQAPTGARSAAFDTRMTHPRFLQKVDHASASVEKRLRGLGFTALAPAQHFGVLDMDGPLADGELERAESWGAELAGLLDQSGQSRA
jgi:hypothetical protein